MAGKGECGVHDIEVMLPIGRRSRVSAPGPAGDPIAALLFRSGLAMFGLCLCAAIIVRATAADTLSSYYFLHQDLWLLIGSGVVLCGLSCLRFGPPRQMTSNQTASDHLVLEGVVSGPIISGQLVSGRLVAMFAVVAALGALIGSHVVMERYALSRDEILAEFAGAYFQQGRIGQAIPTALQTLAEAAMPWTSVRSYSGYWLSPYLPVNSLFRALAGELGDRWLAGPLLLLAGSSGLWSAARRLWPDQREAAVVAVVLALTSTQVLANAMTPYAMTGHFALGAIWLACFVRGGRLGHSCALAVGVLAAGLHQYHFHILFLTGFIVWLYLSGQRSIALLYAFACVGYFMIWDGLYQHVLLDGLLGKPPVMQAAPLLTPSPLTTSTVTSGFGSLAARAFSSGVEHLQGYLGRLSELQPVNNFARFAAWQNILLLPLAAIGANGHRDCEGRLTIALAFRLSCFVGMLTMVYQGHGYGYRYLHGLIPCFCLLAAGGWLRLGERLGRPVPAKLLWASCAVTLLGTLPFALIRSHDFLHPYAAAYRVARAAPANIVFVDGGGGAFLEDIVRIEGPTDRALLTSTPAAFASTPPPPPLLLSLSFVSSADIVRLCVTRRVMVFDARQARMLGISAGGALGAQAGRVVENRRLLRRIGCDHPIPLASADATHVRTA